MAVSAIDPRLRQRRIAVRRAEGRRRLRVVMTVILVLLVGTGAYAATQSPLLDLDAVEVSGVLGSEADAVRDAAGLANGTPMTELDLDAALGSVMALPWVATATIDRNWPGTVAIDVERRVAVAVLPTGDGASILIDAEGVAIERVSTAPVSLPVIAVVAAGDLGDVQTQALPLVPLVQAIPDDVRPWIETLGIRNEGGAGRLEIDLVGSAVAELGECSSRYKVVSSAYTASLTPGGKWSSRSLTYSKNRVGPRTLPCGTPAATSNASDAKPFRTTRSVRSLR